MNVKQLKRQELADVFRVNCKTITRWAADGMPRLETGRYDLADCIAWRIEQADRSATKAAPDEKENSEWLEKYRKERALLARFERRQRQGQFIQQADHEKTITGLCLDLRSTMLAWPARVFPNDDANRARLREEVFSLLDRFVAAKSFAVTEDTNGSADDDDLNDIEGEKAI